MAPISCLTPPSSGLTAVQHGNADAGSNDPRLQQKTDEVAASTEQHRACLRVKGPLPPLPSPLGSMVMQLSEAFATEKRLLGGATPIDNSQPADSFQRLNARVCSLMSTYLSSCSDDWRCFAAFNPHKYVRHLLETTDDFELMVQERRYLEGHTHGVPAGCTGLSCPELTCIETRQVMAGQTGYINDRLYLHSVGCLTADGSMPEQAAVTLHLYAPPIRRVNQYEPALGRVVERTPGFCTFRGV